ncbi:hypothetical protein [Actinocorallia aurantiaca]|uniref:Uncharacterized protein n=1 Tax=Actinocorallia aurantiaca TaxID=46204 RepID=A0ABN3UTN1_9ACTN
MQLLDAFERHPVEAAVVAGCAVVLAVLCLALVSRGLRAMRRGKVEGQRVVTLLGAAIATGLSAQGMYVFFRDSVEVPAVLRIVFFAFLEIMVLGSALRAKASMQEKYSAGIDGVAMWTFTILSAILAATHAHGIGETLFRLSVPLAAAWAWEREMKLERRRRTGRSGLNWTLTPERVLTRLGLADPTDRTASEAGAQHRLMQLALAAKKARIARDNGNRRAYTKALRKLDKAMDRAAELTGLGTDSNRPQAPEEILVGRLAVLYNTESLLDLRPVAPWAPHVPAPVAAEAPAVPVKTPPQAAPVERPVAARRAAVPRAEVTAPVVERAPVEVEAEVQAPSAPPVNVDAAAAPAREEKPVASRDEDEDAAAAAAAAAAEAEALWPFPPRRVQRTPSAAPKVPAARTASEDEGEPAGQTAPVGDITVLETPLASVPTGPGRRSRQPRTAQPKTK